MTDTATVTITVAGRIWFVNSAAASNGDGRRATPFKILTTAGSATLEISAEDLPYFTSGHAAAISATRIIARVDGAPANYAITVGGNPVTLKLLPDFASIDDADELDQAIEMARTTLSPFLPGGGVRANRMQGILAQAIRRFAAGGGGKLTDLISLLAYLPDGVSQDSNAQKLAGEIADQLHAAIAMNPLLQSAGEPLDPGTLFEGPGFPPPGWNDPPAEGQAALAGLKASRQPPGANQRATTALLPIRQAHTRMRAGPLPW